MKSRKKNNGKIGRDFLFLKNISIFANVLTPDAFSDMYRPFEYYFVLAYIMGSLKFHWGL